ncbi:heterokaryon incompatibility protein-domain-containing protein, partial [Xylogone sp. PMI_703]
MSTNGARSDRSSSGTGDAGKALCDACAKLHLGVHRFKVQSWPSRRSGNPAADRALRSSPTSQSLNSLQRIQDKEKVCKLCELILNSVRADLNKLTGENANEIVCSITWEIDGREVAASSSSSNGPRNSVRGLTRRMHIRWNNKHLSEAYLVYEAPESSARTVSDADRVWDKDSLFLGRKVAPGVENQALIHSWLGLCCNTHQGPCRDEGSQKDHQRFHSMLSHSYFGVIDVHNMQLTQLPYEATETDDTVILSSQPYIALSYVWGATQKAYTTDTGNVMLHRTHGGLEKVRDALPEVIRDAIDLVRRLGYQYLWIDRLCIVQDSPRSWKLNAYNMDVIYGNAFLTICAADGDSTAGLRAMRPESHNADQLGATVQPGLSLLVTRPPEMHIRTSQWNERAWTFQERLLSKRCLIFANGRVYFQCRSTGMSEDIYADRKGAGWSLDLVNAPLQIFRQLDYRAIWVYMRCVRLYTERRLSKPRDILAAFNGMSNLMCDRMELPFIHGLPSSHFDIALLWEPVRNTKRRQVPDPENSSLSALDFPSWSWAGWEGSVDYKHNIVGDLLDNVSEWLDNHTWIDWWVRDGHGDLRPLWDDSLEGARSSVGGKWSGYRR